MRWTTLAAFGAPTMGYAFYLFFVQFYFLKFSTDVLLAPPAAMGLLFGLGRLWDAVTDPVVGYWSDRTRSRWGRRRPWMVASIPVLALFCWMVWNPPASLAGTALVAWIALALFGFYAAYTTYSIPHASLGAELSLDHHERSLVFGAHRVAFVLGMMAAFAGIGFASNHEDGRVGAAIVADVSIVVGSLLLLATPLLLGERVQFAGRVASSPWAALRDVAGNTHARTLLATWFVEGLGGGVLGVLAPYVAEYVLLRPDLIAIIPAFYVVAAVVSVPVWIAASRRWGKRRVWRVSMVGNAVFFGATFTVEPGELYLLAGLLAGAGFSSGCGGTIGASMLADVIDYDEYTSGERKEGAYSAAWGFAIKASIALVVVLTGLVLEASGFVPNQAQSARALLALQGLFAGAPVVAAMIGFAALARFTLDEAEHRRIRRELDERHAQAARLRGGALTG
jgi:GPH family glycoside/pentoside/hexuronide:cation symporter